jgi:hypothetical protein
LTPPDETTIITTPSSCAYRSCADVPGSPHAAAASARSQETASKAVVAQLELEEATDGRLRLGEEQRSHATDVMAR